MARLHDLLSEDTNQFGPGTDLTLSLLAMLLVISLITSHMYDAEKKKYKALADQGGNFRMSAEVFTAADFRARPVTRLVDASATEKRVQAIVRDYRENATHYPYIFVIGHSNELDDPHARDRSVSARRRRNMEFALRRAALIAGLLQEHLTDVERDRLIAASTGESDLRNPSRPTSQENARVEVVFGREWKLPARDAVAQKEGGRQ